jgi:hypothetical protein
MGVHTAIVGTVKQKVGQGNDSDVQGVPASIIVLIRISVL